ncbi:helix-turn-helix transcriptional regulator [Arcicella aquatica]|uniref:Helix-turn-helix transcriptional regulator n=1 Tax=Arcicella aquatica TaxID=217141 RepID=A0ABU5QL95_9BACT|nr:helix-turn-helix transcriptional regulator [Arcicella aquatica]MEA5257211.1 helix-turn-helix transcriptional regulator [Arcicella aquatica]
MIPNRHFGEALKKYIEINSITASKIADKLGMTPTGFFAYYKAKNPRPETVEKILKALDISLEDLFKDKKEVNNEEDYKAKYEAELKKNTELQDLLIKYQQQEIEALKQQKANRGETPVSEANASN